MKKDEALARMTCLAPVYASFTTVIGSRPLQQATWTVLLYLRVTCVTISLTLNTDPTGSILASDVLWKRCPVYCPGALIHSPY
jgi:hypothetical protein